MSQIREEMDQLTFGQEIRAVREDLELSQTEFASKLAIDRSLLSKIETGEREAPALLKQNLARMSWRMALTVADEATGGFFSNILHEVPNLDLHPAALKDVLLKELAEAEAALEELVMAKHLDPEKRRQSAEKVWHETRDVLEKAAVMMGVLEEEFGLDRKRLTQKHEMEVKQGTR